MNNKAPLEDLIILGSGPVGLITFLALAKYTTLHVQLVVKGAWQAPSADPRVIALSHGSVQLLEQLGLNLSHANTIDHIHISHQGHIGQTQISSEELQQRELGLVVKYGDLMADLHRACELALAKHPHLGVVEHGEKYTLVYHPQSIEVIIADKAPLECRWLINSEGGLFSDQGAQRLHYDYGQSALIAMVQCEKHQAYKTWAWERFTSHGPVALLPCGDQYSLVWCTKPEEAQALLSLAHTQPEVFLQKLSDSYGHKLGRFTEVQAPQVFPLGINAKTQILDHHVVYVGNSAQTIHPVAGQGLNLGIRDAYELALSCRFGVNDIVMKNYAKIRQKDRQQMMALTHGLARGFVKDTTPQDVGQIPLVLRQLMANIGFLALNTLPPVRSSFFNLLLFGGR